MRRLQTTKKQSVFKILILIYLIIIIITISIAFSVSRILNIYIGDQIRTQFINTNDNAHHSIENELLTLQETSRLLSLYPDVLDIKSIYYKSLTPYEQSVIYRRATSLLATISNSSRLADSIGYYIKDNNIFLQSSYALSEQETILNAYDDLALQAPTEKSYLSHLDNKLFLIEEDRNEHGDLAGLFYINISEDYLKNRFKSFFSEGRDINIVKNIDGIEIHMASSAQVDNSSYDFLYEKTLLGSIHYYSYLDNSAIRNATSTTAKILFSVILFLITVSTLFIVYMRNSIQIPIKTLLEAMDSLKKGNFTTKIEQKSNSELDLLYKGFNSMSQELKVYMGLATEQALRLKQSELRQLQSQINPHFLYNCFYNISQMCKLGNTQKPMELSQKLSNYYMYITRSSGIAIPLKDEYHHARTYLDIQKIRFGDRVSFDISPLIDNLSQMLLPKLTIQPIVENCYKHVFDNIEEGGIIRLLVQQENNLTHIIVKDNGHNITDEQINDLSQKVLSYQDSEITGLTNVARRLELFYRGKATMEFARSELGGLKVQITIEGMTQND